MGARRGLGGVGGEGREGKHREQLKQAGARVSRDRNTGGYTTHGRALWAQDTWRHGHGTLSFKASLPL